MLYWFFKQKPLFESKIQNDPFGDYSEPKKAQTLGVLGTFVGITWGLILLGHNNTAETLKDGVMYLLGGMSTAFLTSILGMILSWYLNNYQDNAKNETLRSKEQTVDEDSTLADLISYLQEQDKIKNDNMSTMLATMQSSNKVLCETISSAISDMQRSVVGDSEYTVIGQIKQIRLENRDEMEKTRAEARQANETLITEFRDFAKTMAENNTKVFIEALNETMKDFNTKLTEQFGENFKQLNDAVGKLLEWQIHYKETIEEVTKTQKEIFDGIISIRDAMNKMKESSDGMTTNAEKMGELIVTASLYNERLSTLLKDIQQISEDAKGMAPNIASLTDTARQELTNYSKDVMNQIKTNIDNTGEKFLDLTTIIEEDTTAIKNNVKQATDGIKESTRSTVQAIQDISLEMQNASRKARDNFEAEAKTTHDSIKKAADSLQKSALNVTKDISDQLEEMMKTNNENLKKSSENLSKDLDDKISNSLTSMGNAMGSISQKFADDYTPIANRLAEIVRIAKAK